MTQIQALALDFINYKTLISFISLMEIMLPASLIWKCHHQDQVDKGEKVMWKPYSSTQMIILLSNMDSVQ